LLEVVGEALEGVSEIRVVCNGDLDPYDVKVAKAAREGQQALAGLRIFRENTEREAIADSYNLNRITEVVREFNVRR